MIIPSASAPNLRELATPELREGSERIPSPAPTVASSIDAQIAGLAGYGDTSAYNTDDEADLVPREPLDAAMDTDGDVELAEAEPDPIEEAVSYTYAVRRS